MFIFLPLETPQVNYSINIELPNYLLYFFVSLLKI